ncbi:MFS transporter [Salinicola halophilus]|uniref:MFS transporter n=1 Tax=Salinicola halophilus TaxID=184065 RepID=UPI000DA1616C|nr:MFS transporter [Salinicola halophilus]
MTAKSRTSLPPTVWGLALCQALLTTGSVLLIAVSPLVGAWLAPSPILSTLPVATQLAGLTAATLPAGYLTARWGRKRAFVIGNLIGLAGVGLCGLALLEASFIGFVIGTLGIGASIATGMLYRFAAVDVVGPEQRDSALSWVMAGGVIAAFAGPWLARHLRDLFATEFLGAFAGLAALYGLALLILLRLRLPGSVTRGLTATQPSRPPGAVRRRPALVAAVLCAALGYSVMNLAMTATPLAMTAARHDFGHVADVIQWHMLAMFAPSFVTGRLIRRLGHPRMIAAGALCLLMSLGCSLLAPALVGFIAGLVLLGLGWNFTFLAASAWLTTLHGAIEAPRLQAINDFSVFSLAAIAALMAGPLQSWLGWQVVNLLLALPVLVLLALALRHARSSPTQAPSAKASRLR